MKARLLGPFLMMALGAALLGGSLLPDPLDVGIATTTTLPCGTIGQVDPCATTTTTDPCPTPLGVFDPCATTTTTSCGVSAVLVVAPCPEETTTTTVAGTTPTTDPDGSTTAPGGVLPADDDATPAQPAPNPANGELARTGSSDLPLTIAGSTLIVVGAGLALAGRRHRIQGQR